ncbi:hypothetical protein DFQ28_006053 [Apophysomyces sp. BC1034]|nr:hypothetical protein DFQ28_006053 [Apophysomyces sp. BC1034]
MHSGADSFERWVDECNYVYDSYMDVLVSTTNSDLPPPPPSICVHPTQNLLLTKPFQYIPKPSPSPADISMIDPSTDVPMTPDYSCAADLRPIEECNNEPNCANWTDIGLSMMMQPYYYQDELVNGCYTDDSFDIMPLLTTDYTAATSTHPSVLSLADSMITTDSMMSLPMADPLDNNLLWDTTVNNNHDDSLWYFSYMPSSPSVSF